MHTLHEDEVPFQHLPGREHRILVGADHLGAERMCLGTAVFSPTEIAPPHAHQTQEEIIYIFSGRGEICFDDGPEMLRPGTCIYIPPGVTHQILNPGPDPIRLLFVFSPPATPDLYEVKND